MTTLDVYTIGGIDYLTATFNGLIMIFGNSSYQSFLLFFMIFGTFSAITYAVLQMKLQQFATYMLSAFIMFNAFFTIKADVNLIDTKYQRSQVIANVPLGPAFVSSLFSSLSYEMTHLISSMFMSGTVVQWSLGSGVQQYNIGSDLGYEGTGLDGAIGTPTLLTNIQLRKMASVPLGTSANIQTVRDFNGELGAYINQCVIPNFAVGTFGDTILNSRDIFTAIGTGTNMFFSWNDQTTDCKTAYNTDLAPAWTAIKGLFVNYQSNNIMSVFGITPQQGPVLESAVNLAVQAGGTALSDQVAQTAMMYATMAGYSGYMGQAQEVNAAEGYQTGAQVANYKQIMIQAGLFVRRIMPILLVTLQCTFLALTPLISLGMFIPGRLKIIQHVIEYLAWIYCWDPVLAVIGGLSSIGGLSELQAQLGAQNLSGLTITTFSPLQDDAQLYMAIAGGLATVAPALALAIVKGGEYAMLNVVGTMMHAPGTSGAASTIGQAATTGATQAQAAGNLGQSVGGLMTEMQRGQTAHNLMSGMAYDNQVQEQGWDKLLGAEKNRIANATGGALQMGTTKQAYQLGADATAMQAGSIQGEKDKLQSVINAGIMPAGSTLQDGSRAQHRAGTFGTSTGRQEITADGQGGISQSLTTSGDTRKSAGAQINYNNNSDTPVSANLDNFTPSIDNAAKNARRDGFSSRLMANKAFTDIVQNGSAHLTKYGVYADTADLLSNSTNQNFTNTILNDQALQTRLQNTVEKGAGGNAGLPQIVTKVTGQGANLSVTWRDGNNHEYTSKLTGSDADAFSTAYNHAVSNTLRTASADEKTAQAVHNLMSSVGLNAEAGELHSIEASRELTADQRTNLTGAFVAYEAEKPEFAGIQDVKERNQAAADYINYEAVHDPQAISTDFGAFVQKYDTLKPADTGNVQTTAEAAVNVEQVEQEAAAPVLKRAGASADIAGAGSHQKVQSAPLVKPDETEHQERRDAADDQINAGSTDITTSTYDKVKGAAKRVIQEFEGDKPKDQK